MGLGTLLPCFYHDNGTLRKCTLLESWDQACTIVLALSCSFQARITVRVYVKRRLRERNFLFRVEVMNMHMIQVWCDVMLIMT